MLVDLKKFDLVTPSDQDWQHTVTVKLSGQRRPISGAIVTVVVPVCGPTMTKVLKSNRRVQTSREK